MASINKTKPNNVTAKASAFAPAAVTAPNTYVRPSHNVRNHHNTVSYSVSDLEEFRRTLMSCMLWENTAYEGGVSIADRLGQLVPKLDPEQVVKSAVEARTMMKLRHAPLLIAVEMLKHPEHKKHVRTLIPQIVNRADEMAELLSLYWRDEINAVRTSEGFNSQRAKRKIPMQLLRGIRLAFAKFDDYQITKYLGNDKPVKMADVIRLVHPDPKDAQKNLNDQKRATVSMANVYKSVVDGGARAPEDTWEVALSAAGREGKRSVFENLLDTNKLPAMALLRNLRGMTEAGVSIEKISTALERMRVERILPYRFITARRYAPNLSNILEQSMFKCLAGVEKLPGKTVLLVDNSGSMDSRISAKSEMNRVEAATGLAILAKEICEQSEVLLFDTNTFRLNGNSFTPVAGSRSRYVYANQFEPSDSVVKDTRNYSSNVRGFALADAISRVSKGGTDLRQAINYVNANIEHDRIIVFTDEQSSTVPSAPKDNATGYIINVASYQNGIGYGPWTHINGFSEATLAYISEYEKAFK